MNIKVTKYHLATLSILYTESIYATGIFIPVNYFLLFDAACFIAAIFIVFKHQKKNLTIIWLIIVVLSYIALKYSSNLNYTIYSLMTPASIIIIAIFMRVNFFKNNKKI